MLSDSFTNTSDPENKATPIPNDAFAAAATTANPNHYNPSLYPHPHLLNMPLYLNSNSTSYHYSAICPTSSLSNATTANMLMDYDLLNSGTSSELAMMNVTEDQLPSVEDFDAIVNNYLDNLSTKKRDKALVDKHRYSLILQVLRDPRNTAISTAQFRFWVKKMFRLSKKPSATADYTVCHDNKPVATREEIYDILVHAHKEAHHGGRDKTSALVRKRYSWIPKELIARFVRHCPFCISRRNGCQVSSSPTTTSTTAMTTPMTATTLGDDVDPSQPSLFLYPTSTPTTAKSTAPVAFYPHQYFQPLVDFTLSQEQEDFNNNEKSMSFSEHPNTNAAAFFYPSSFNNHLQHSQDHVTYSPKPSTNNMNVFNLNSTAFYPYMYDDNTSYHHQQGTSAAVVTAAALNAGNPTTPAFATTLEQQQEQIIQLQQLQQQQALMSGTSHYLQEQSLQLQQQAQSQGLLYSPLASEMLSESSSSSISSSIITSPQPSQHDPTAYIKQEKADEEDNILSEQALNDLAALLQQQQHQFDEEEKARTKVEQQNSPCKTKSFAHVNTTTTISPTNIIDTTMSSAPTSPNMLNIAQPLDVEY